MMRKLTSSFNWLRKCCKKFFLCREGEELGWPSSAPEPMMAPLGTMGKKSVSLKLTLHECNKSSSNQFLYYTNSLSSLALTQQTSPALIHNSGKRERKSIAKSMSHKTLNRILQRVLKIPFQSN